MKINSSGRLASVVLTSAVVWLLFSVAIYLFNGDAITSLGPSLLLATLYYSFFVNNETAGNFFHPYSYFIISGGLLSFGLPAVLAAINPVSSSSLSVSTEHLAIVSFLIAASFVMYSVGYKLPLGQKLAWTVPLLGFPKRVPRVQYIFTALVLYGVGWVARISAWGLGYHHKNPNLGEAVVVVSSVLQPLSIFATLSFVIYVWDRFRYAKKNRVINPFSLLVIILIVLEVLAGMLNGSRSLMILPLLHVAFVYHYTVKSLSWRHIIAGAVVLVWVLAPAATIYRGVYYDTLGETGASVVGARVSLERLYGGGTEQQYENVISSVTGRLSAQLEGALVVYEKVPRQVAFAEGGTFFPSAFVNFVPRLFWADKPIFIPGREFAQIFWGVGIGELYATNMGIGWVGEAYYNFGWFGLVIPIVLGVVMRFFVVRFEAYSRIEKNWAARLFFVLFVVPAIGAFHHYPGGLVRGAMIYVVYLSLLNHGFPRILRIQKHILHQRLACKTRTTRKAIL